MEGRPTNNTLKAQEISQSRLPTQEGFATSILATNFSAQYNVLYGPDGVLWITQREGKNITRLDPNNGSRLSVVQ